MALFQWDESFSVKIKQFDDQHKKLVAMVNELHDAMKAARSKEILGKTLDGLINYTVTHFAAEEKLMQAHRYPQLADHKKKHDELTATALKLQEDFRAGRTGVNMDVLNFLKSWLIDHIKGDDRQYGPYFNSKGVV